MILTHRFLPWMHALLILSLTVGATNSHALVCLRAPGVSDGEWSQFLQKQPECGNGENILKHFKGNPEEELESLLAQLREQNLSAAQQAKLFESFFNKKKKQMWSSRDVEIVTEVLRRWEQIENSIAKQDQIRALLSNLESARGLYAGENPTPLKDGFADGQVYRNSERLSISALTKDREPAHWVVFSSLYKPIFHWGRGEDVLNLIHKHNEFWLSGSCETPGLQFTPRAEESYLFLYPNQCVARRASLTTGALPFAASTLPPPTAKTTILQSPWFWVGSALTVLALSSLRGKNLVIRPAGR